MLINISRELCIGAAPCVAIAGNVFQMDDEAKAILVGPSTDDENTRLAAEACPTRAIFLYTDDKVQTFPPVAESPRVYIPEPIVSQAS
jgi:ferredoxin